MEWGWEGGERRRAGAASSPPTEAGAGSPHLLLPAHRLVAARLLKLGRLELAARLLDRALASAGAVEQGAQMLEPQPAAERVAERDHSRLEPAVVAAGRPWLQHRLVAFGHHRAAVRGPLGALAPLGQHERAVGRLHLPLKRAARRIVLVADLDVRTAPPPTEPAALLARPAPAADGKALLIPEARWGTRAHELGRDVHS